MLLSPRARANALLGAAIAATLLVAGCGAEAGVAEHGEQPGDPAPAVRALKLYLDDDRCDLLSPKILETISADTKVARKLCDEGHVPVDALVRPGEYKIKDAEVIDGQGLVRVTLNDGGIRDYTLEPGGPEGFIIDQLKSTMVGEYGDSLRIQARETGASEPIDARITVVSLKRIQPEQLSIDEYVSSMDHYYLLRVRIRSRSDKPQVIGTTSFELAQKDGVTVANSRDMYTDLGKPLPSVLAPGKTNSGDVFFAVPEQQIARPTQVKFVYGDKYGGDTLVWNKPAR